MKQKNIFYLLVERKSDGKRFVMWGNIKVKWYGYTYLFDFCPETHSNGIQTPFGRIYERDTDMRFNSREYEVINKMLCA